MPAPVGGFLEKGEAWMLLRSQHDEALRKEKEARERLSSASLSTGVSQNDKAFSREKKARYRLSSASLSTGVSEPVENVLMYVCRQREG